VTKIRRGDHVLEIGRPMQGFATGKLVALIRELEMEGLL